MKIDIKTGEYREERLLLCMMTDAVFLSRLASKWESGMGPLASSETNLIGSWCVKHFKEFNEAPRAGIRMYFEDWARGKSDDDIRMIDKYIIWLRDNGWDRESEYSSEQMLAFALDYINKIKIGKLVNQLTLDLQTRNVSKALETISSFTKEELGKQSSVELLIDNDAIARAFVENTQKSIINFEDGPEHDGLRRFFGPYLTTDSLIAFQGAEKSGKTFMLVEMAIQALLSRKRVAFFEVGDMSEEQIMRRMLTRISERPIRSPTGRFPCKIRCPLTIRRPQNKDELASVTYIEKEFSEPLDEEKARKACADMMRHRMFTKKSLLRLSCHHNFDASVATLQATIKAWRMEDWIPEVVIIDYADLLHVSSKMDFRHAINQTWGRLRRFSQENHCLVITATQADAESYRKKIQDKGNFSEDKRKNSHVTGIIGINVTPEERRNGILRLNWIGGREVQWDERQCCYLATCLPLANPAVCSDFPYYS